VKTLKQKSGKKKQANCSEMELNPSKDTALHEGDNPSFQNEFINITFLTVPYIFISLTCTEVPSYSAVKTPRDIQSTSRDLDLGVIM
jgi:hypothetical protein